MSKFDIVFIDVSHIDFRQYEMYFRQSAGQFSNCSCDGHCDNGTCECYQSFTFCNSLEYLCADITMGCKCAGSCSNRYQDWDSNIYSEKTDRFEGKGLFAAKQFKK